MNFRHLLSCDTIAHGYKIFKATITLCDLSQRFFLLTLRYFANFKAMRYESTSLNRIVADKSHRVIVA